VACRETKPKVYLTVISKIMPKEINVQANASDAFLRSGKRSPMDWESAWLRSQNDPLTFVRYVLKATPESRCSASTARLKRGKAST
jgi:hypothetical protein